MGRREELLRAEAEGWEELIAVLDATAPDLLERPGVNAEGWAVRDVTWHLAFWCSDAARALDEMSHGSFGRDREPDGPAQVDAVNDRELERSRRMEPDQVRAELHGGRAAMLERFGALEALTADADEWFEESGSLHYAEHLPELERSRRMEPDQVRAELHGGRAAMLERFGALEALTADADEWFEESGSLHYAEHLPELEAWIRAHPR